MTKIKIDFSLKTRFQETSLCDLTYFHFQHVLRFHLKVIQKFNNYIFLTFWILAVTVRDTWCFGHWRIIGWNRSLIA